MSYYTGMDEWCNAPECTAPIINGVPLCQHSQEDED